MGGAEKILRKGSLYGGIILIFVTVGTHEQQFNRLVSEVDRLKRAGRIAVDVVMQTGYSDYKPTACECYPMMSAQQMEQHIREAEIVITHGGPGSIFGVLKQSKIPIVVPRRVEFKEHVDPHQVEFAKHLQRSGRILTVYDIQELEAYIVQYKERIMQLRGVVPDGENRKAFIQELKCIVNRLLDVRQDPGGSHP